MSRFRLSNDCPCAYELFPVSKRLARKYGRETGHESVLFQTDWDYPGLAESLGWSLRNMQVKRGARCNHSSTDGTVTCSQCGLTATAFITGAAEWLDEHIGDAFNDPHGQIACYFGW